MQFLKTALWVVLAVAIALFCKANNRPVELHLWGEFVWDTKIWFPIACAFVLGVVPVWFIGLATRWRLKKKVESLEKALASATAAVDMGPAVPAGNAVPPVQAPLPPPSPTSALPDEPAGKAIDQ